jgi:iron complex transport system substrate-binding protein
VSTTTRKPARAEHARTRVKPIDVPRHEPRRILSLEPAATEILCALGVGARLVGVSPGCDHPRAVVGLPTVTLGGPETSDSFRRRITGLDPDLVIAPFERPPGLAPAGCTWLALRAASFEDVLVDVLRVGTAAWAEARGDELARAMDRRLERLERESVRLRRPTVAVLESVAPLHVAGRWIPELVRAAGGEPSAHPEQAEHLLVALPGLGVDQSLAVLEELPRSRLPAAREIVVTDGHSFFHRPGPRLVESAEILALTLHQRRFAGRFGYGRETLLRWRVPG